MKKFTWKLQRLLDVKQKQEQTLRNEIITLAEQAAIVRGRMMAMKMRLRAHQREIQALPDEQRIGAQSFYLQYVPVIDKALHQMAEEGRMLENRRRGKMEEFLKMQKFRKGLERLKKKAQQEYFRQVSIEEQKQLDDYAHIHWNRPAALAET
jgi:flagellar biosynthesis chaperone FliJ